MNDKNALIKNVDKIEGVFEKDLISHLDIRGHLIEAFRIDDLPENIKPVMSYVTFTQYGFYRGPHEHKERIEIFVCPGPGNLRIILWDNRKKSSTYLMRKIIYAGEDNPKQIVIYPGIVHIIENITKSKNAILINFPTTLFKGWGRNEEWIDEIRHDKKNNIFWKDFLLLRNNLQ